MSKRFLLGLDSCGTETTLALGLIEDAKLTLARESKMAPRTGGSLLTGALQSILDGIPLTNLYAIVATRGPGSFTGIRVGLSAIKGLSEASGVPVVAVSRLAVLAEAAQTDYAALHAARGHVYLRETASGAEQLLPGEQAAELIAGRRVTVCEERAASMLPSSFTVAAPAAADTLRFGMPRVLAEEWEDLATLDGLYLWRADQMLRAGS